MRLIAHRANINGPNPETENSPIAIEEALAHGFEVEIDIWRVDGKFYFGHDKPQYEVSTSEIGLTDKYWYHAKNLDALLFFTVLEQNFKKKEFNYFWHENDNYTLTNKNYIWTYPGRPLTVNSICMHPEQSGYDMLYWPNCLGLCSDNIIQFK